MTIDGQELSDDDLDFVRMVVYFTEDKGDPTRFTGWDEERCKRLMPLFHDAWVSMRKSEHAVQVAMADLRSRHSIR